MYVCMYVFMYVCKYVCIYVYICMYVCMYVFMYIHMYVFVCVMQWYDALAPPDIATHCKTLQHRIGGLQFSCVLGMAKFRVHVP